MDIYEKIDSLLKKKKATKKQMCAYMDINYNSLMANYTRKSSKMPFDTLLAIAKYFDVSIDYLIGNIESPSSSMPMADIDIRHIIAFQRLNSVGKEKAMAYVKDIQMAYPRKLAVEHEKLTLTKNTNIQKQPWVLPLFNYPASAGQGVFAGEGNYELAEVPEGAPASTSFGVRICGDSMEPAIPNHSIVWVRQQPDVDLGDICIVVIDGEGYCKQRGKNSFKSINPKYKDIKPSKEEDVRISGKVVYVQKP